jgi:malate:Na+ symporter
MPSPAPTVHPEGIAITTTAHVPGAQARTRRFWPQGWWRLVDIQIGIIPLPVYLILVGLLWVLTSEGEIRSDAPTMIAVLVLGGFTCAEIGKRLPVLRQIGAGAIFATFIPSALVYYALIPGPIVKAITDFTKFTNFLYLYIAAIIVGSIGRC